MRAVSFERENSRKKTFTDTEILQLPAGNRYQGWIQQIWH